MKPRFIHKTLLESFELCEYYAYLHHYHSMDGVHKGITKGGDDDPRRALGSAIHAGVGAVALGTSVDAAVGAGHAEYAFDTRSMIIPATLVKDHRILIEAEVRLWAAVQLPIILASGHRVVASEQTTFTQLTDELTLMARPDIELMAPDGRVVNYSLKTEKSHAYIKHPNAMIDVGGTVESIAMATKYGGIDQVAGTWMTYMVLGEDKLDSYSNEIRRYHPLVRGWQRGGDTSPDAWAWTYEYPNPDYDPNGPRSAAKNPKNKSLGKGWHMFDVADFGVKPWLGEILARQVTPIHVDPVGQLIVSPELYDRTPGVAENYALQVIREQSIVNTNLAAVREGLVRPDEVFSKRRTSCMKFGRRCEMWDICWKGAGVSPEALTAHNFVPRLSSVDKAEEKGKLNID